MYSMGRAEAHSQADIAVCRREQEAADLLVSTYTDSTTGKPLKPVVGFISGRNVPPGQTFGHSGAIWRDGLGSADQKRQAWKKAGIRVADTIAETGPLLEELLTR